MANIDNPTEQRESSDLVANFLKSSSGYDSPHSILSLITEHFDIVRIALAIFSILSVYLQHDSVRIFFPLRSHMLDSLLWL